MVLPMSLKGWVSLAVVVCQYNQIDGVDKVSTINVSGGVNIR